MQRTVMLSLSNFQTAAIPASLKGTGNSPLDKLTISIRRLCHHMLLDTHGLSIAKSNPLVPLYQQLITASVPLEFKTGALGTHKDAKIPESTKLGKAFCRWFLAEHFQATYFGHMDHLLDKAPLPQHGNIRVVRTKKKDTPDYLCADSVGGVFLAEAKGRQDRTIDFKSASFKEWRKQFQRIKVEDANGNAMKVKGYIVATRFKMKNQSKAASRIYAEDPESPGEIELTEEAITGLRRLAIHRHYSSVFEILGLLLHADVLRSGQFLVPEEPVVVGVWRCLLPQFDKLRFIGGLLPSDEVTSCADHGWWDGWSPELSAARRTFFGLESCLFKGVLQETRQIGSASNTIEPLVFDDTPSSEQVSLLRDGTLLAPASFMRLEDVRSF